jgi:hypothetical protein
MSSKGSSERSSDSMKSGMEIGWYTMVDEISKAWIEGAWGYLNQRDRGQLMGAPGNTKLRSLGQGRRRPCSGDWGTESNK